VLTVPYDEDAVEGVAVQCEEMQQAEVEVEEAVLALAVAPPSANLG
jgi:hypothetical protein